MSIPGTQRMEKGPSDADLKYVQACCPHVSAERIREHWVPSASREWMAFRISQIFGTGPQRKKGNR